MDKLWSLRKFRPREVTKRVEVLVAFVAVVEVLLVLTQVIPDFRELPPQLTTTPPLPSQWVFQNDFSQKAIFSWDPFDFQTSSATTVIIIIIMIAAGKGGGADKVQ